MAIEQIAARRDLSQAAAKYWQYPQERDRTVVIEVDDGDPARQGLDTVRGCVIPRDAQRSQGGARDVARSLTGRELGPTE